MVDPSENGAEKLRLENFVQELAGAFENSTGLESAGDVLDVACGESEIEIEAWENPLRDEVHGDATNKAAVPIVVIEKLGDENLLEELCAASGNRTPSDSRSHVLHEGSGEMEVEIEAWENPLRDEMSTHSDQHCAHSDHGSLSIPSVSHCSESSSMTQPSYSHEDDTSATPLARRTDNGGFRTICWECRYGKTAKSRKGMRWCREIAKHTGPDCFSPSWDKRFKRGAQNAVGAPKHTKLLFDKKLKTLCRSVDSTTGRSR